jgi:hypothetical protein
VNTPEAGKVIAVSDIGNHKVNTPQINHTPKFATQPYVWRLLAVSAEMSYCEVCPLDLSHSEAEVFFCRPRLERAVARDRIDGIGIVPHWRVGRILSLREEGYEDK